MAQLGTSHLAATPNTPNRNSRLDRVRHGKLASLVIVLSSRDLRLRSGVAFVAKRLAMHIPLRGCVLLALVLSAGRTSFAQSVYGSIRGRTTVKASGQPLPGVTVLVSSLEHGDLETSSAQTDDSGFFTFGNLPLGAYIVSMKKDGYQTFNDDVTVSADNTSEIDVQLLPGDPTTITKGEPPSYPFLTLDRADVGTSFSRHEMESLPIFEQNVSFYELLVPGAVRTLSVLPSQQNPQGGVYASVSGQPVSGTAVFEDGTANRDPISGVVVLNPSLDFVSELKITTQNYSAEFGPATGGIFSIQTRSGTNQFHGSAFGHRLSGFGQAGVPNFGETSVLQGSSQKRNDFGASVGGAAIRDRLFLFADYRGIRSAADGTVLLTVPTRKVHETCTGNPADPPCDLSEYVEVGAPCLGVCNIEKIDNKITGTIDNEYVSPQMVNFLNLVPLPNVAGAPLTNNYRASGVDSFNADDFDTRADYLISKKMNLFARYSFADFGENGTPAFGPDVGGLGANPSTFAGVMKDRNQGISAGFLRNLTSSLLTDFRFGFFRYNLRLDSLDTGTTPATNAGINGLNLPGDFYTSGMPDIQLDNPNLPGLPVAGNIDFMRIGYSNAANSCECPLREREQLFQFVDNWTKPHGNHNIRWGADLQYLQNLRLSSDSRRAGHLEFAGAQAGFSPTGFSLGDFLIGAVTNFDRTYANPDNPDALNAGERQKRLFFYGEDTWRLRPQLTINYGLRWEIYLPQSVTGPGAGGWLQLGSGTKFYQDQFRVAGEGGTNLQGGVKTTLKNFGPRVGLAYQVNRKTVIRAGYGRVFDPGYAGTIFGIAATQSPPVALTTAVYNELTINSNKVYEIALQKIQGQGYPLPYDVCENGVCTIPPFYFPPVPFTVEDLYNDNRFNNPSCPTCRNGQWANLYAVPRRLRLPTVDAWNLAVQEALDHNTYLEISYVANKGTHVVNDTVNQGAGSVEVPYYDLNVPTLVGFIGKVHPPTNCITEIVPIGYWYCKTQQTTRQAFDPWPVQVNYFGNDASSEYNSLQVKIQRQFSSGFSLLAHYTWSKVVDFDNSYYAIDPIVDRGLGNFDRAHSFVMTNIWDLPLGRGHMLLGHAGPVLNQVAGGWSLAAITSWSSGLPFTPTYSGCDADVGGPFVCRPNLVGMVHITGSSNRYFTTTGGDNLQAKCVNGTSVELCSPMIFDAANCVANGTVESCSKVPGLLSYYSGFNPTNMTVDGVQPGQSIPGQTIGPWQRPGAGQIGDAGRNSLRGPGFFQADLAVAKNIPITERVAVQFRADAFNVFNKVNRGNPNPLVDVSAGGDITSLAFGAIQRQMQFSLRVNF